jgi:hypothetical protein
LNKIRRKIGNKGGNVKDIPYVVKEKAATHYMWLAAFSHKATIINSGDDLSNASGCFEGFESE